MPFTDELYFAPARKLISILLAREVSSTELIRAELRLHAGFLQLSPVTRVRLALNSESRSGARIALTGAGCDCGNRLTRLSSWC